MTQEQKTQLKQFIGDKLGYRLVEVTNKTLFTDLGLDALDFIEIIMECERMYDIRIEDEIAEDCVTIGDFIKMTSKLINNL